ncbi:ribose-5-phosphate isomerase RpiA [Sphingomonas bacterium]|uniref:ribose-5-phosphate isomerase RpiA n=1 Tax=Sphingomonas bacterium TaxID=1895847 RepID=UPI0015759622|nr:ribose-5-phosphate isomerase RpiA [Sphingomonas bacterium]
MQDDDKRAAALAAVAEVRDDMLVGLGTGSTAYWAIAALGERVAAGLRISVVATSEASAAQARDLAIPLLDMAEVGAVDLTIDGADEIDGRCFAIKGAGGAMTREKIVAAASRRMVVIADGSKRVERIGGVPLPVEVLPFAQAFVTAQLKALRGHSVLREKDGAPYLTDSGNLVLDVQFAAMRYPVSLARKLDALPGVIGHGLFLREVDAAYIADGGIVTTLERSRSLG